MTCELRIFGEITKKVEWEENLSTKSFLNPYKIYSCIFFSGNSCTPRVMGKVPQTSLKLLENKHFFLLHSQYRVLFCMSLQNWKKIWWKVLSEPHTTAMNFGKRSGTFQFISWEINMQLWKSAENYFLAFKT